MNDTPEHTAPDAEPEPTTAEPSSPESSEQQAPQPDAEPVTESAAETAVETALEPVPSQPDELPAEPAFARRLELILEALLLAADGPLPLEQMQKLVAAEFNLGRKDLRAALERMAERYADSACELREVASGWRLQVRAEYGEWVGRLWQEKPPKYSRALLETLALIVYRQPITRGEIEDVRGVVVSTNILRTLQERGWVREVGHKEVPGRPALYGSAPQFLDDFNLKSLDQLPQLPEIKDLDQLEAALQRLGQGAGALAALGGPAQDAADGDADESTPAGAAQAQDEDGESGADASEHDQSAEDKPPSDAIFH